MIPPLTPERELQFWNRVRVIPEGCWEWIGSTSGKKGTNGVGYGTFSVENRQFNAHRVAAFLTLDDFSPELWVLHRCDNPRCVRPSHLFMGVQLDNFKDALNKGRSYVGSDENRSDMRKKTGENNNHARLSNGQVQEIRMKYRMRKAPQTALAKEYGVHQTQISRIVRGSQWTGE